MLASLTVFFVCLAGAGLISSIEAALVGITESRIRYAIDQEVPGAESLHYWLREGARILTTLRFVQLVCVAGLTLGAWNLLPIWGWTIDIFWLAPLIGILVLVACHLIVRPIAINYAFTWAKWMIGPVRGITLLLAPIVWPLHFLGQVVSTLFGDGYTRSGAFWTADALEQAAADARANLIGEPGEQLMESIISFSDTLIREIMVPRTEMVAVPSDMPARELRKLIISTGHSRIPIYEETVDNVLGVLHVKDFLVAENEDAGMPPKFASLIRASFYVPEVMKISELLREFQRRKTHLAIVVDEYGGTAGVVTLEDIIEEIVGEIQDEYDVDEKQFRQVGENKIIADARVNLGDIEEIWDVTFPDDGTYETLAGFLMAQAGYLLEVGSCVRWENLVFTVKEANEKRIKMVEVERKDRIDKVAPPIKVA